MNRLIVLLTSATLLFQCSVPKSNESNEDKPVEAKPMVERAKGDKPRLLVLTDIGDDPDDEQSMVRLLVYANHFDIEGIVTELWWEETHSGRHGALTPESQMELMHGALDLYAEVLPNLDLHAKDYPRPEELHKVVKRGKSGIKMTLSTEKGDPLQWIGLGQDTEGSDWIIEVVDREDGRPVDIAVWGGPADLAQALMKVRDERSAEELEEFLSRIRVHAISDQDDTGPWIRENFPSLFYILDHDPNGDKWESCYRGMFYGGDESLTSLAWIDEHVRQNHGPLGAFYPPETNTNKNPHGALKEGDTPSWFYFYPNGLQMPDRPDYGGWGGRYKYNGTFWQDAYDRVGDDFNGRASVYRWRPHFQNDFSARMDWCVKPFDQANHSPVVALVHKQNLKVKAGENVSLNANGTIDPDGHKLNYKWWQYKEAGTYTGSIEIQNSDKQEATINTPTDGRVGDTIHIILEVTDSGTPSLTAYQRVILTVKNKTK